MIVTKKQNGNSVFLKSRHYKNIKQQALKQEAWASSISTDLGYQYFTIIYADLEATLSHTREHFASGVGVGDEGLLWCWTGSHPEYNSFCAKLGT